MNMTELGISKLQDNFEQFVRENIAFVEGLASAAGSVGDIAGAFDDSALHRFDEPNSPTGTVLVLDIGGTHSKVGICRFRGQEPALWTMLFDRHNEEFHAAERLTADSVPLRIFVRELGAQTVSVMGSHSAGPEEIVGVSVIWSNALQAVPLEGSNSVHGVTGLVTSYNGGTAYRKGEWFVQGLHDGFDLGAAFLEELAASGIKPKVFVIGNDTVFTLKALPGAHAGVVSSSGANATLIDSRGVIRNSELGARIVISDRYLSEGDRRLSSSVRLEDIIAGKGIGRFFTAQLEVLREQGVDELVPVLASLSRKRGSFRSEDITVLLQGEMLSFEGEGMFFSPEAHHILRDVAKLVTVRGGYGAAALIVLSLIGLKAPAQSFGSRGSRSQGFVVALDSAMARHLPGYFDTVKEAMARIESVVGAKVTVELLTPEGFVTVPMRGAANAVGDFLG